MIIVKKDFSCRSLEWNNQSAMISLNRGLSQWQNNLTSIGDEMFSFCCRSGKEIWIQWLDYYYPMWWAIIILCVNFLFLIEEEEEEEIRFRQSNREHLRPSKQVREKISSRIAQTMQTDTIQFHGLVFSRVLPYFF